MGKKKLSLQPPASYQKALDNYNRRLPGLIKKADEIGKLTSAKVFSLVTDPDWNYVVIYSNDFIDTFFASYQNIVHSLSSSQKDKGEFLENKKVKIEEECQYVDPDIGILDITLNREETIYTDSLSFYINNRRIQDYIMPYNFSSSYVPLAKSISKTQYLKKKSQELSRNWDSRRVSKVVLGKSMELETETKGQTDLDSETVYTWLLNSHKKDVLESSEPETSKEGVDEDYELPDVPQFKLYEGLFEK